MTTLLTEGFPLLAGSPRGISKLRALIFTLAASGRLVEGDKNAQAVPLEKMVEFVMGQAPPGNECNKDGQGFPFVKTGEFGSQFPEIREWTTKPLKFAKEGDVLICVVGATVGKLNLGIDCAIGRSVAAIRPTGELSTKYLYYCLMPFTLKLREKSRGSAQGVIGKADLSAVMIRFASKEEQERIVTKVDELMALCDRLEACQAGAEDTHAQLVQTLLDSLVQASDADDFAASWQRLSEHFHTLFTTESSIDAMKQALLQLAVMGKLVPQDPNDEAASTLAHRIREAKRKLLAGAEGRKQKELAADLAVANPYEVPASWEWKRIDDVLHVTGGVTLGRKLSGRDLVTKPYLRVANVQRGHLDLNEIKEVAVPEDEVAKYLLRDGDLLITEGGDWDKVGRTAVWRDELSECLHQNHVFRARPVTLEWESRWAEIYLNSATAREYFAGSSKQTTNLASINMTQLRACAFPLPPLAEQRRIIAKVDELMDNCNRLRDALAAAGQLHGRLADALVERTVA